MGYYSRKLRIPFHDAVNNITESLKQQGFGIITTIDMKDTFKKRLDVNFRNYKILGACNPQFAHNAISLESHIGIMLPCNVVVQEHENGEIEITAVSPLENFEKSFSTPQLKALAIEVGNKLRTALDNLQRDYPKPHNEALPGESRKDIPSMQG